MTTRTMTLLICGLALAVSKLPNNREIPAAASETTYNGIEYAAPEDANATALVPAADYCPPESEPMTVCTPEGCYRVSGPVRSVVKSTTRVVTAPARVIKQSLTTRQVFRANERFMQRGPARRFVGRVGRGVCRVVTAPARWLRCR